jgi:hypothetical protein
MKKTLLYLAAGVAIGYYLLSMKKSSSNASAAADELPKGANPAGLGDTTPSGVDDQGNTMDVSRKPVGRSGMDMADPQFSGFVY